MGTVTVCIVCDVLMNCASGRRRAAGGWRISSCSSGLGCVQYSPVDDMRPEEECWSLGFWEVLSGDATSDVGESGKTNLRVS